MIYVIGIQCPACKSPNAYLAPVTYSTDIEEIYIIQCPTCQQQSLVPEYLVQTAEEPHND